MAEAAGVEAFRDDDRFLRRIALPDHVKHGLVRWRVFKDRDSRLSLTFQDEFLATESGLDGYQRYCGERYLGGSLPGICWLSYCGLTVILDPPLEPIHDPDPDEPVYGHLHCSTPQPRDKPHMELLAKLVNDGEHGGLRRPFVPTPRQLD